METKILDEFPSDQQVEDMLIDGVIEVNLFEIDEETLQTVRPMDLERKSTFLKTFKKDKDYPEGFSVWLPA